MKQATLNIDLNAIYYNYNHLKCYYKKNIITVLKDDAYGLGLIEIANALKLDKSLIIAISSLTEAVKLRENNFVNDILYLNVFDETDLEIIKQYNITVCIQSLKQLKFVKNTNISFHLKVNTGMNRLGIYEDELNKTINELNIYENKYNLKGIMTHFANDDKYHISYYKFEEIVKKIKKENLIIHCFASSSLNEKFNNLTTHIRVGIKLYGIGERNSFLHNAITIKTPILTIKPIDKYQLVGYDLTYETKSKGFLYILPLGYGQGWGRFNNSLAYIENNYLIQAGKISMDYSTYFSTNIYDMNSTVELINNKFTIETLAKINKIDPHEILVKLKLPKEYSKTSLKK